MTVHMGEPMRRPVQFRALNLPNILTYGRIAAAPLVGLTYYTPNDWGPVDRFAIFALASITDYFRRLFRPHLGTAIGARPHAGPDRRQAAGCGFDPHPGADGVLDGWSIWAAIIVLMREVFVSGLREFWPNCGSAFR
jgi:cardiolipin synthase